MLDPDLALSNYDYALPKKLIAYEPTYPKEKARLLIFSRKENKIIHTKFGTLNDFLPKCEIIFNDTKVIKARIFALKENGKRLEIFIHKALNEHDFLAQIKGKVRENEYLKLENAPILAKILSLNEDGTRIINFSQILQDDYQNLIKNLESYFQKSPPNSKANKSQISNTKQGKILNKVQIFTLLEKIGHIPLPPYIKRADCKADEINYQSIFAKKDGAVAAPTASLHFSKSQITELSKTHPIHTLTLHVGAGTFKGVEAENIALHRMHEESYEISKNLADLILSEREILCVGTTTARCVEYFWRKSHEFNTNLKQNLKNLDENQSKLNLNEKLRLCGECDIFLHPKNPPKRVNYLLTNFHLPKSTLIMLVSAFIGREKTLEIYKEAILKGYKFYSYGDAMLIL